MSPTRQDFENTGQRSSALQTQKPAAATDTWNAFESADDSKTAAAASSGDNSWANFESAPAAAPAASSDPVAVSCSPNDHGAAH